jgi:hypothetical protein
MTTSEPVRMQRHTTITPLASRERTASRPCVADGTRTASGPQVGYALRGCTVLDTVSWVARLRVSI